MPDEGVDLGFRVGDEGIYLLFVGRGGGHIYCQAYQRKREDEEIVNRILGVGFKSRIRIYLKLGKERLTGASPSPKRRDSWQEPNCARKETALTHRRNIIIPLNDLTPVEPPC